MQGGAKHRQREIRALQFWDDYYKSLELISCSNHQGDDDNERISPSSSTTLTTSKEWILKPSKNLFRKIVNFLPIMVMYDDGGGDCDNDQKRNLNDSSPPIPKPYLKEERRIYRVLEIGCGTSVLSRELCRYIQTAMSSLSLKSSSSTTTATRKMQKYEFWVTDVSAICIRQNHIRDQEWLDEINKNTTTTFEYKVLNASDQHQKLDNTFDLIIVKGCFDTLLFVIRKAVMVEKTLQEQF